MRSPCTISSNDGQHEDRQLLRRAQQARLTMSVGGAGRRVGTPSQTMSDGSGTAAMSSPRPPGAGDVLSRSGARWSGRTPPATRSPRARRSGAEEDAAGCLDVQCASRRTGTPWVPATEDEGLVNMATAEDGDGDRRVMDVGAGGPLLLCGAPQGPQPEPGSPVHGRRRADRQKSRAVPMCHGPLRACVHPPRGRRGCSPVRSTSSCEDLGTQATDLHIGAGRRPVVPRPTAVR